MGFLAQNAPLRPDALGSTIGWRAQEKPIRHVDYAGALDNLVYSFNPEQANKTAGQQNVLADMLMQQAQGKGPSLAQEQFAQALAKFQEQQAASISSQKGINPALAARLIGEQGASYGQQAAAGSGQLRAQEILGARGQLAEALSAQRGQDLAQQNSQTQRLATLGQLESGQSGLDVRQGLGVQDINANIEARNSAMRERFNNAGIKAWSDSSQQFMKGMGMMMAEGGRVGDFTDGGEVPGEPKVGGDSEKNDVVLAMLSPDEIVLPRTVAMDESGESAKSFVQELAKSSSKKSKGGYSSVIAAKKNCGGKV